MDNFFKNPLYIIYYTGSAVILAAFVWLVYFHFKEDDNINFQNHFFIILIYISLLVLAFYLWGIISGFIFDFFIKNQLHQQMTEYKIG